MSLAFLGARALHFQRMARVLSNVDSHATFWKLRFVLVGWLREFISIYLHPAVSPCNTEKLKWGPRGRFDCGTNPSFLLVAGSLSKLGSGEAQVRLLDAFAHICSRIKTLYCWFQTLSGPGYFTRRIYSGLRRTQYRPNRIMQEHSREARRIWLFVISLAVHDEIFIYAVNWFSLGLDTPLLVSSLMKPQAESIRLPKGSVLTIFDERWILEVHDSIQRIILIHWQIH